MWLWDDIKRRFLTATRAALLPFVVISLSLNPISVYASDIEEYRPSYTWADELRSDIGRDIALRQTEQFRIYYSPITGDFKQPFVDLQPYKLQELSQSYADTIRRFEDNARRLETKMRDSIDLQLNKPVELPQLYVDNVRRFETKIMGDVENLSKSSILTRPIDFERYIRPVRIRGIQEFHDLVDRPSISVPSLPTIQDDYGLREGTVPVEVHRSSYTWAEELGRDFVRASEVHERMTGDLGRRLNQMPEDLKAPIKDLTGPVGVLMFDVPDIARTRNADLRKIKGIQSLTGLLMPTGTSTLNRIIEREYWDEILPREPYIPSQEDIDKFQNWRPWIMEGVTIQEFRNDKLISTQHYETLDFDRWREQLQRQEHHNRIDFLSLERELIRDDFDFRQFANLRDVEVPTTIQHHYNPIDSSFIDLPSSVTIQHDYDLSNRMSRFEDIQMPKFESIRIEPMSMPSFNQMSVPTMPMNTFP